MEDLVVIEEDEDLELEITFIGPTQRTSSDENRAQNIQLQKQSKPLSSIKLDEFEATKPQMLNPWLTVVKHKHSKVASPTGSPKIFSMVNDVDVSTSQPAVISADQIDIRVADYNSKDNYSPFSSYNSQSQPTLAVLPALSILPSPTSQVSPEVAVLQVIPSNDEVSPICSTTNSGSVLNPTSKIQPLCPSSLREGLSIKAISVPTPDAVPKISIPTSVLSTHSSQLSSVGPVSLSQALVLPIRTPTSTINCGKTVIGATPSAVPKPQRFNSRIVIRSISQVPRYRNPLPIPEMVPISRNPAPNMQMATTNNEVTNANGSQKLQSGEGEASFLRGNNHLHRLNDEGFKSVGEIAKRIVSQNGTVVKTSASTSGISVMPQLIPIRNCEKVQIASNLMDFVSSTTFEERLAPAPSTTAGQLMTFYKANSNENDIEVDDGLTSKRTENSIYSTHACVAQPEIKEMTFPLVSPAASIFSHSNDSSFSVPQQRLNEMELQPSFEVPSTQHSKAADVKSLTQKRKIGRPPKTTVCEKGISKNRIQNEVNPFPVQFQVPSSLSFTGNSNSIMSNQSLTQISPGSPLPSFNTSFHTPVNYATSSSYATYGSTNCNLSFNSCNSTVTFSQPNWEFSSNGNSFAGVSFDKQEVSNWNGMQTESNSDCKVEKKRSRGRKPTSLVAIACKTEESSNRTSTFDPPVLVKQKRKYVRKSNVNSEKNQGTKKTWRKNQPQVDAQENSNLNATKKSRSKKNTANATYSVGPEETAVTPTAMTPTAVTASSVGLVQIVDTGGISTTPPQTNSELLKGRSTAIGTSVFPILSPPFSSPPENVKKGRPRKYAQGNPKNQPERRSKHNVNSVQIDNKLISPPPLHTKNSGIQSPCSFGNSAKTIQQKRKEAQLNLKKYTLDIDWDTFREVEPQNTVATSCANGLSSALETPIVGSSSLSISISPRDNLMNVERKPEVAEVEKVSSRERNLLTPLPSPSIFADSPSSCLLNPSMTVTLERREEDSVKSPLHQSNDEDGQELDIVSPMALGNPENVFSKLKAAVEHDDLIINEPVNSKPLSNSSVKKSTKFMKVARTYPAHKKMITVVHAETDGYCSSTSKSNDSNLSLPLEPISKNNAKLETKASILIPLEMTTHTNVITTFCMSPESAIQFETNSKLIENQMDHHVSMDSSQSQTSSNKCSKSSESKSRQILRTTLLKTEKSRKRTDSKKRNKAAVSVNPYDDAVLFKSREKLNTTPTKLPTLSIYCKPLVASEKDLLSEKFSSLMSPSMSIQKLLTADAARLTLEDWKKDCLETDGETKSSNSVKTELRQETKTRPVGNCTEEDDELASVTDGLVARTTEKENCARTEVTENMSMKKDTKKLDLEADILAIQKLLERTSIKSENDGSEEAIWSPENEEESETTEVDELEVNPRIPGRRISRKTVKYVSPIPKSKLRMTLKQQPNLALKQAYKFEKLPKPPRTPNSSCRLVQNPGYGWTFTEKQLAVVFQDGSFVMKRSDINKEVEKLTIWRVLDSGGLTLTLKAYEPYSRKNSNRWFHVSNWTERLGNESRELGAETVVLEKKLRNIFLDYLPVYVDRICHSPEISVVKLYRDERFFQHMPYITQMEGYLKEPYYNLVQVLVSQAMDPSFLDKVINSDLIHVSAEVSQLRKGWSKILGLIKTTCKEFGQSDRWSSHVLREILKFPKLSYSAKNCDKERKCDGCALSVFPQHCPTKAARFDGYPYDYENLTPYPEGHPENNKKQKPDFQFCHGCNNFLKNFHSLYHLPYHILATIHFRLEVIHKEFPPDAKFDSLSVKQALVADIDWFKWMLLDFLVIMSQIQIHMDQMARCNYKVPGEWDTNEV